MIKKLIVAAALIAVTSGYAVAGPTDFYASPMNSGAPTNLPGETIIPGMTQAMTVINTVTQPILQPMLAPGGGAPMMEKPMMKKHRHRMMKKKMMMKKMGGATGTGGQMPGGYRY